MTREQTGPLRTINPLAFGGTAGATIAAWFLYSPEVAAFFLAAGVSYIALSVREARQNGEEGR